ncbi:peptidoglycan glycosyltransferase [Peptococcaceae bacterium SCADC1_2_3]|nr:peptidoglycan glycosyltransferase [Peptococcaceae bacterium SCADC1_2_3]
MGPLRKKRISQVFFLIFLFFIFLQARLGIIQIKQRDYYAYKAIKQETLTVVLEDYPRGKILDRYQRSLTGTWAANRIVIFPALIPHKEKRDVMARLISVLKIKNPAQKDEIKAAFSGAPKYLSCRISKDQAQAVQKANLPGVFVLPVNFRYGEEPLAVQVVGHLGRIQPGENFTDLKMGNAKPYELGDWVGRSGLESYYEEELKATRPYGYARIFLDAKGRTLPGLAVKVNTKANSSDQQNIITTLDADLQRKVEKITRARLKKGVVVVMEAASGDILALVSRPAYQPQPDKINCSLKAKKKEAFLEKGTALYQPGSVFKVVVAAAALAEGVVTPDTAFFCRGAKDKPVRCWYEPGHGKITFTQAFAQSCNPVFAQLAQRLGAEKIIDYAQRLRLDNQQVIGYPAPIDRRQNLSLIGAPFNLINSSLGQGPVLATPVQITAMINTIANEGIYKPPRLVQEIKSDGNSASRFFKPGPYRQVVSPDVARQMKKLLEAVVKEGVGQQAYLSGYGSAGKTGSAQTGEQTTVVQAWFSGYAPRQKPKYVITVLVEEGNSGGQTAAPVFKEIMTALLKE